MALARKCDRCGKLYEGKGYTPDITVHIYRHPYGEEKMDFCNECLFELERFLNIRRADDGTPDR